ncbi:DUF4347 domain-containing protein [Rhodospira trueperi]|uniref:Putative Ig domain-containing protein n=1 Tax=Rhodospira trueperi TaxID=69960 RepID=A0A1G7FF84_9PROT|nr:DUF4347 domain-containing protein [Rhodospira trueperi]SDE74507.1 Putative Ig domain-containing protein [Rhodospira trueperi]
MGFVGQAHAIRPRRPFALALEPRLMFDGAAAATAADAADPAPGDAPEPAPTAADRVEVALVDTSVDGHEALAEAARDAGLEVIVVAGDGDDGFGGIIDALAGRTDIDALHILSHGGVGVIDLGGRMLSAETLDSEAASDLLAVISGSLSADGDLLLYGCRIGAEDAGQDFLTQLAIRTGADVAASDDPTGAAGLGGDWDLEVTTGAIEATPWTATGVEGFAGVLAFNGTIDFDNAPTSGARNSGQPSVNATYTFGAYTLVLDGESNSAYVEVVAGDGYAGFGGSTPETKATLYFQGGETFDVTSLNILNYAASSDTFIITSDKGDSYNAGIIASDSDKDITLTGFTGITKLYIDASDGTPNYFEVDNITFANLQPPGNDPVFTTENDGSVSETATNGTVVLADGDIQANDGDGGGADVGITYSITAGNGNKDGDGNSAFAINASTGAVTVNDADDLDFETTGSYTLTIRADDGGGTVDTDVTITVTNQAPVITSGQSFSVNESDTNTTAIGTVANTGDDDGVTFSIKSGNTGNAFAINASTGQITVNDTSQLDASATPSYTLDIRATDGTTNSDVTVTVNVTDDVGPTVASVASSSGNGTYKAGDTITVTVQFDEVVTVTGTPLLTLETGATDRTATYASGSGTNTLSFTYTVQAGDTSTDLDYTATTALALNGGTIKDSAGNDATLTLANPGTAGSLGANAALVVDAVAPTVAAVSSSSANGPYGVGDTITVTVQFDEAVTVTGTPTLTLETGTTERTATYASGSGTDTLSFTYTVQAGDTSADLDYTGTDALALNGGTIEDSAGNNATLTLPSPGAAGSLGANKALVVDGTAPTVSAVSSSTGDGAYGIGDTITVTVRFDEAVTVTGTPTLTLETGTTDRTASYASGSGSDTLNFTYTVQAGDTAADLDYTGTTALALASGTIRDSAGNDATLTLANPGATGSLGANKALVVDGVAPTVASVASSSGNGTYKAGDTITVTVQFGEAVTVTGTPTLTLETGATDRAATYASGSGTNTLSFTYTVQAGDASADLDYISTAALALAGGTIRDSAGNDATLTLASPGAVGSLGANAALVVDGVAPVLSGTITPSVGTITDSQAGTDTFTLTIDFGEAMNTGVAPTITFPTENPLNTLSSPGGAWTDGDTYVVTYDVSDVNEVVSNIDVRVADAQDAAGNTMAAATQVDIFSIITAPAPTISSVTSSSGDGTYGVGDAVNVTVTFDEGVDFTANGGTLRATLSNGATVTLASGDAANQTAFSGTYTVQEGDTDSADLDVASVSLTGAATLKANDDAVPASLNLPGGQSLADTQDIVVDGNSPAAPTIDLTTASDTGASTTDNLTNDTTPTVSGTGETGATVTVFADANSNGVVDGGESLGTTTVSGGTWSLTTASLGAGTHNLRALQTDAAGNASAPAAILAVTVDTTAPTAADDSGTVGEDDGAGTLGGLDLSANDTDADGTAPVAAVSGQAGNVGTPVAGSNGGLFTVNADGSVSFDPNGDFEALDDGGSTTTSVTVAIQDTAGNTDTSTLTVTVNGANDAPSGTNRTVAAQTGEVLALQQAAFGFTDPDTGDTLDHITVDTKPATGTLFVDADGSGAMDNGETASADGDMVSRADIAAGRLLYRAPATAGTATLAFTVNDGTVDAVVGATLTLTTQTPPDDDDGPDTPPPANDPPSAGNPAPPPVAPPPAAGIPAPPAPPPPDPGPSIVTVLRPPAPGGGEGGTGGDAGDGAFGNTGFGGQDGGLGDTVVPDTTTSPAGGSFPVAVIAGGGLATGGDALVALRPTFEAPTISDGGPFSFTLPPDVFAHTDAGALVQLNALMGDGEPLPDWLAFDPATGTFVGEPPPGASGEMVVRVIARDQAGREAVVLIRIDLSALGDRADGGAAVPSSGPGDIAHAALETTKPTFTDEVRLARASLPAHQAAALLALSRDVAAER